MFWTLIDSMYGMGVKQLTALLAAVASKEKLYGARHWRLGEYMAQLVDLYKGWGKPQQAAEWSAKKTALDPQPPEKTS